MFGYSLYYPKYMAQKILPMWRELAMRLQILGVKPIVWTKTKEYFERFKRIDNFEVLRFIYTTLQALVERRLSKMFTQEMSERLRLSESGKSEVHCN
jgi:hypothetical protein